MSPDDPSTPPHGSDPRSTDIRAARAQFEAARLRQQRLAATDRPPAPSRDGALPSKAPPGYTLLRELHRGGQGVVYLAVQKSTDRRVAIKVLHHGPLGGSSATELARFEREVEALSLLKHPNIVTIHDCGRDDEHVYLVMDYVDGRPLDAYAGGDRIPLRDTLDLFARVCDGVNAAHLRGVIHRDLKPGNILVDERGEPHVLDFGLAKLVNDPPAGGGPAQVMTVTGQFVGSLPWASPEQAEGRGDQLDIRTDVYSLGVVLYQLLTGRFPYPVSGRLADVVRHIVHTSPARPSTVGGNVDRELETILLKCLAKEPERRYQGAGELARDIRRYLAGEPIEARRDSLAYVMGKQLARYRVAAIAAAVILLVVSGALIVSVTLWRRAERQGTIAVQNATAARDAAQRAGREADQARAVTEFMREVLTSVEPENQGADVRLIQVLARASATASERFAGLPQQEGDVRALLGHVYDRLSMWTEALAELERAAELYRQSVGPDDPRTLDVQLRQASSFINIGRADGAERVLHDLAPRLERLFGPDDARTLEAARYTALTQLFRGRVDEAERMLEALRGHPRLIDDDEAQVRILSGLVAVGLNRASTGDPAASHAPLSRADSLAPEWIERSTRLYGPDAMQTLLARVKCADLSWQLGRHEAAAEVCRAILDSSAERLGECHHIRTDAMYILAGALAGLGEDREPAELHLRRIACERQRLAPGNPLFLASLSDSLWYLDRGGRAAEGEALARELGGALLKGGGQHGGGDALVQTEVQLAHFVSMQERLDEAETLFRSLLSREDSVADSRTRARLHMCYGIHLTRRGQLEDAERHLRGAVTWLEDVRQGTWDVRPDDTILAFIALYEAWGKPDRAEEYQRLRETTRRR